MNLLPEGYTLQLAYKCSQQENIVGQFKIEMLSKISKWQFWSVTTHIDDHMRCQKVKIAVWHDYKRDAPNRNHILHIRSQFLALPRTRETKTWLDSSTWSILKSRPTLLLCWIWTCKQFTSLRNDFWQNQYHDTLLLESYHNQLCS